MLTKTSSEKAHHKRLLKIFHKDYLEELKSAHPLIEDQKVHDITLAYVDCDKMRSPTLASQAELSDFEDKELESFELSQSLIETHKMNSSADIK